ncbi:right handed beta helix region, partial [Bacteroidales bacterium 6E]
SISNTSSGPALYYNGYSSSSSTGNEFINNIFKANGGLSVHVANSSGVVTMDYNDLFTSGSVTAVWGNTDAGDLLAWQTISGHDANSLSFDPQYVSDTDLTASSAALANAGTPLSAVTTDINGDPRKVTPSIGANEYDASALVPMSGVYTINASGIGERNFTTIQGAVDAMVLNGLGGSVVFEIAAGTYAEQVLIPDISGGSDVNTVTFESATGLASDVVIQYSATSTADNYVIRLSNASDMIFRNLTIQALGTAFSRTLHSTNRLDNLLVEGCEFLSTASGNTSNDRGNVVLYPSSSGQVRFTGNSFQGGSFGLLYRGHENGNGRAPGFYLEDNEFTGIFFKAVVLERQSDTEIRGNVIAMTSGYSGSQGIELTYVDGAIRVVGNRVTGARSYAIYFNDSQA